MNDHQAATHHRALKLYFDTGAKAVDTGEINTYLGNIRIP